MHHFGTKKTRMTPSLLCESGPKNLVVRNSTNSPAACDHGETTTARWSACCPAVEPTDFLRHPLVVNARSTIPGTLLPKHGTVPLCCPFLPPWLALLWTAAAPDAALLMAHAARPRLYCSAKQGLFAGGGCGSATQAARLCIGCVPIYVFSTSILARLWPRLRCVNCLATAAGTHLLLGPIAAPS